MEKKKVRYRVRNWGEYNDALVQRGSLTLWLEESAISQWHVDERKGKRGAPTLYSDWLIQMALVLREVFHLPLRALEGFLRSIVQLMALEGVLVPDYTTLCRRQKRLQVTIPRLSRGEPLHIAIDSSGLKIHGEGEWHRKVHGAGRRRSWRKLHIGVDCDTRQVVSCELTASFVTDDQVLEDLLEQLGDERLESVAADGAYDSRQCHKAIADRKATALIPPREDAVEWEPDHPRTGVVRAIREQGRKEWKQVSGYHRRSLAENAFFRLKTLFSDRLKNRSFEAQCTEAYCRIVALNRMTALGMPESVPVVA